MKTVRWNHDLELVQWSILIVDERFQILSLMVWHFLKLQHWDLPGWAFQRRTRNGFVRNSLRFSCLQIQGVPKTKNPNQNWVLWGQFFPMDITWERLILHSPRRKQQKQNSRDKVCRLLVIEPVHRTRGSSIILLVTFFWDTLHIISLIFLST